MIHAPLLGIKRQVRHCACARNVEISFIFWRVASSASMKGANHLCVWQGHAGLLNVPRIFNVSDVSANESKPVKRGKVKILLVD